MKMNLKAIVFLLLSFSIVTSTNAISSQQRIDDLLKQADAVFDGTVINVEHRLSQELPGQPATPYTFVTYTINQVLKGNFPEQTATLRFIGGVLAPDSDEFILIPHQPLFDVGDHDVLLVEGNTEHLCPLVDCAKGRFRYIDGMVVNEEGQTISINENGGIELGGAINLRDINTHRMSDRINLSRVEIVKDGETSEMLPLSSIPDDAITDTATFTAYMQDRVYSTHTADELASLPEFRSADPNEPLIDKALDNLLTPTPPPESVSYAAEDQIPENDALEMMVEGLYRDRFSAANSAEEKQKIREEIWAKYPQLNPYAGNDAPIIKHASYSVSVSYEDNAWYKNKTSYIKFILYCLILGFIIYIYTTLKRS